MSQFPPGYKPPDPLEKEVEKAVCSFAVKLGWRHKKWQSDTSRSAPDQIFWRNRRVIVFIEFKRKGKKATKKQQKFHEELREDGFFVFVCDSVDMGKQILLSFTPVEQWPSSFAPISKKVGSIS